MRHRGRGIATLALLLALPAPVWAGSSQAALAVGVVVPARCAVQTPSSFASSEGPVPGAQGTVAMRCTRGTVPSGGAATSGAVADRIADVVALPAAGPAPTAPRPLAESSPIAAAAGGEPQMTITINF